MNPGDLITVRKDAYLPTLSGKIGLLLYAVEDRRFKGFWVVLINEQRLILFHSDFRVIHKAK